MSPIDNDPEPDHGYPRLSGERLLQRLEYLAAEAEDQRRAADAQTLREALRHLRWYGRVDQTKRSVSGGR